MYSKQWMKKVNNKNNETHRETINCRRLVIESPFYLQSLHAHRTITIYVSDASKCIHDAQAHTVIILISLLSLKFSNLNGSQQTAAPSDAS